MAITDESTDQLAVIPSNRTNPLYDGLEKEDIFVRSQNNSSMFDFRIFSGGKVNL